MNLFYGNKNVFCVLFHENGYSIKHLDVKKEYGMKKMQWFFVLAGLVLIIAACKNQTLPEKKRGTADPITAGVRRIRWG
jgi:hypothetical protein